MKVNTYEVIPLKIGEKVKWFLKYIDTADSVLYEKVNVINEGELAGETIPKFDEKFKSRYFVWTNDCDISDYLEVKEDLSLEAVKDEKLLEQLSKVSTVLNMRKEYQKKITNALLTKKPFSLSLEEKNVLANKRTDEEIALIEEFKVECPDIKEIYQKMRVLIYGQDSQMKSVLANIKFNIDITNILTDADEAADVKKTMLLIGSTGTGKSLIVKTLAKLLNIPYVIEDATRYTANGFDGESVENILVNMATKNSLAAAQRGIIFIDEFDKICKIDLEQGKNSFVGTTAVQQTLLKLLEGTVITKRVREGFAEKILTFDTRRTIFVLSGAFQELSGLENITEKVLISYGMLPELAARISPIIRMNTPTKEDLRSALTCSPRSYLQEIEKYLTRLGIDISYEGSYLDSVAERAYSKKEGYRGLRKVIDEDINPDFFDLMSGDKEELVLKRTNKNNEKA